MFPTHFRPASGRPHERTALSRIAASAADAAAPGVQTNPSSGQVGHRPCDPAAETPSTERTATEIAEYWIDRALRRPVNAETRQELIDFMAAGGDPDRDLNLDLWTVRDRLRSMVGLILTSPDFHWR